MATVDVVELVEKLSQSVVFADPTDLPLLADLHTQLQQVGDWAREAGYPRAQACTRASADLVESIILDEASDPAATLGLIGRSVSSLQQAVSGTREDGEVDYPPELKVDEQVAKAAAFKIELPTYVDESILAEFLGRQESGLQDLEVLVLALESGADEEQMASLKRHLHTLKGESAMLGIEQVERLCHAAEDALGQAEPATLVDSLLELKDWLARAFDAYAGKGAPPEGPEALLARFSGEAPPAESTDVPPSRDAEGAAVTKPSPPAENGLHFEAAPLTGDQELIADFITEAMEHLDNSDVQLLTLETDPKAEEALNAVFRAFHTIKGVAGFIALDEIKALAHEAENLLDQARKGQLTLEGRAIDLVFSSVDVLKQCIEAVRHALDDNADLLPNGELPQLVRDLKAVTSGEAPPEPAKPQVPMKLGDILIKDGAITQEGLERALEDQGIPEEHRKLGALLVQKTVITTRELVRALEIQKEENFTRRFGEVLLSIGALTQSELDQALEEQQAPPVKPKLGEVLVRSGAADARDVAAALRKQRGQDVGGAVRVREAVKVDADRLDQLVDTVGELVIAETMVTQSPELLEGASTEVIRHVNELDKITRELQEMATSLRMVPVRATFQKMARLARDLSKKSGKPVKFNMVGEETELDKSVVDKIGDPLVHMIRNSVDHGLEDSPADRVAAGKSEIGNVTLRAYHKGGNIHVEIQDDGRGLNRDAIMRKAIERGLVREGEHLSDREVYNLIFEAGFSTAKKITEVSGRGVGMDVVKRNIEALRGQVEITSEPGKGTTFTIRLPLTLAIIDGMVIRAGRERFIIPTLSIVISVRPGAGDLNTVSGQGEMVQLQGKLLPLFRLHRMFRVPEAKENPLEATVVVVESEDKLVALLIDEIIGQQQIVIKPLGEALKDLPGIAGGAIMPDGRVGLILDVAGVVRLASDSQS